MGKEDEAQGSEDDDEKDNKSEKKRQREKQRRVDITNAFDELAAFISQVDHDESPSSQVEAKKKRKKSNSADGESGTRVDLISRAVKVMKRLHRENLENKRVIETMRQTGGKRKDDDKVS
jgi:hypothetical protein